MNNKVTVVIEIEKVKSIFPTTAIIIYQSTRVNSRPNSKTACFIAMRHEIFDRYRIDFDDDFIPMQSIKGMKRRKRIRDLS